MPNVAHSNLTSANLHEPKGVAAASANTIYVANGAGSGTWQALSIAVLDSTFKNTNKVFLTYVIDDVSTAGSHWVAPGIAGDIAKITTVISGAISGADAVLTLEIAGTLVTTSAVTIANSGSAAGDIDTASPSAAKTITTGQAIEIITDGASTGVVKCTVVIEMDVA